MIVPGHEQLERERVVEDDNERFMLVKKVVLMTTPRSEAFDALLDRTAGARHRWLSGTPLASSRESS